MLSDTVPRSVQYATFVAPSLVLLTGCISLARIPSAERRATRASTSCRAFSNAAVIKLEQDEICNRLFCSLYKIPTCKYCSTQY